MPLEKLTAKQLKAWEMLAKKQFPEYDSFDFESGEVYGLSDNYPDRIYLGEVLGRGRNWKITLP